MLGKQAKADLPEAVSREPFHESLVHEAARADLNARRRGTASSLTRGEVSMTTAKAWRQKGTGRARAGALSVPAPLRRRRRLRAQAPPLHGQGQPQGPPPRAARRSVRARRARHGRRDRRLGFDEPLDQEAAADALEKWDATRPMLVVLGPEEDGRRQELPQHRARPRRPGERRGCRRRDRRRLAGRLRGGARAALEGEGQADGPAPGDHPPGRLGEELRADGRGQVHLPGPRPRPQDPDRATPSRRSSASTCARCAPRKVRAKPKRRGLHARHDAARGRRRRPARARASGSSCSRARRWRAEPWRSARPSRPAPDAASATYQLREELTGDGPTKSLTKGKKQLRRAQRQRPRHLAPPRRRRQAPLPPDRLQAPQGRRAGQGRDDRVRPQPHHLHRAAQLRRRREELHPRPAGPQGRRRGRSPARAPTSGPATRWR